MGPLAGPPGTHNTHTHTHNTHTHTQALEEGRPIPHELRPDAAALRNEAELEDDNTAVPRDHVDDEYAHAGERDPKARFFLRVCRVRVCCVCARALRVHFGAVEVGRPSLVRLPACVSESKPLAYAAAFPPPSHTHARPQVLITTSRDPSSRLTQFAKEMRLVVPNAQRINRRGAGRWGAGAGRACAFAICLGLVPAAHTHHTHTHTHNTRGGMLLSELVESCRSHDFTDVIVLHEHRGEPGAALGGSVRARGLCVWMCVCCLCVCCSDITMHAHAQHTHTNTHTDGLVVCHLPYGPTAYFGLFNAVLRHDIGAKKEVGTIRCAVGRAATCTQHTHTHTHTHTNTHTHTHTHTPTHTHTARPTRTSSSTASPRRWASASQTFSSTCSQCPRTTPSG